ncbi:MAG: hypothetical protein KDK59_09230 [Simkania sp.]|nr:hypothetical protein [Simkania sp.]
MSGFHPVRSSHVSGPNLPLDPPKDPPKDKSGASHFPGVDTLYSAAETVKSTFSSFVFNVLNGAQIVVETIAYVLFYPFLNHDLAQTTPEVHAKNLEKVKDKGTDLPTRFGELEASVRVAVRNKGDLKYAKEIISAFAEVQKDVFEEIASEVIRVTKVNMDSITLTPGAYVLMCLKNDTLSIGDFYLGLDAYRMKHVDAEDQFTILSFQVEMAEHSKLEVTSAQQIVLLYAEINPGGFKRLAECLAELTDEVNTKEGKTVEASAKEWVEKSEKFKPALVRQALDSIRIMDEIEANKDLDLGDQLYHYTIFINSLFPPKKSEKQKSDGHIEITEARQHFIAKKFLNALSTSSPKLMKMLSMQMIKRDEESTGHKVGLFAAASADAKWGKVDFDPVPFVLAWTKEEKKFDVVIILNALQSLQSEILSKGFTTEELGSYRLNFLDRAMTRLLKSYCKATLSAFLDTKENEAIGLTLIQAFVRIDERDAAKSDDAIRLIPKQPKGADLKAAVLQLAEEIQSKGDTEFKIFQARMNEALDSAYTEQFTLEMESKDLEFSKKLNSFLLLGSLKLQESNFPKEMIVKMANSAEKDFAKLAIHVAEKFAGSIPAVKALDEAAKESELHPSQIAKKRQEDYAGRSVFSLWASAPVELTEVEKAQAKENAYRTTFLAHFEKKYNKSDLDWLRLGMRSYLTI